ncbi:MAG: radical SAM protein [Synergistaceae bacterium]|jgi:uncharacterized protein|nr:radical SAM protein [Synergistaceae bacterium]
MMHLQVLWLDDGQCVLFNVPDKRISGRAPAFVGRVAEKIVDGKDLTAAIAEESVDPDMRRRIVDLLTYIGGERSSVRTEPFGRNEKRFGNVLALCPSTKCNLRCMYCSGNAGNCSDTLMDWDLAKTAIDYYFAHAREKDAYVLQFHGGGEPMLNMGVIKKSIDYARSIAEGKGGRLTTKISTNGYFSPDTARWAADTFNDVSLSLDGPPDIHDRQRPTMNGKGSYDVACRTLRILEEKGVHLRINTVITNYGIDRMEEIIGHIRSVTRTTELRLLPMEYCGRCAESGASPLDFERYALNLEELLPAALSLDFDLLDVLENADYYTDGHYCRACGYVMCVAPHGRISTCIEVMDEASGVDDLLIGRYDGEKIVIDWNAVFRLRDRTYHNLEPCKKCAFRSNCSGNCLVRAGRKNGTVMSVDPDACAMTKKALTKYFANVADSLEDFVGTECFPFTPGYMLGGASPDGR